MSKPGYVIDTSVAVKWFLKESLEDKALELRDAFKKRKCILMAPDLIYGEFANTIWKRVKFNKLDENIGKLMVADFMLIPIDIVPSRNLLLTAFKLATDFKQSVYDALYLALSVLRNSSFITADEKFYNAISSEFSNICWLGKFSM